MNPYRLGPFILCATCAICAALRATAGAACTTPINPRPIVAAVPERPGQTHGGHPHGACGGCP